MNNNRTKNNKKDYSILIAAGSSLLAGTAIAGVYAWGINNGIFSANEYSNYKYINCDEATAIVLSDGNANLYMIDSYEVVNGDTGKIVTLNIVDGREVTIDSEYVTIVSGNNSYAQACTLAQSMIGNDGELASSIVSAPQKEVVRIKK